MSPQEPTPTPDDETPWKPLAIEELTEGQEIVVVRGGKERRFRVKSVNREGNNVTATMTSAEVEDAWYWPIAPAPNNPPEFNTTALSKAAAEAVRQVTEYTISAGPTATDNQVINPSTVELTARWIGERESTHTWPEIREDDKACYRDAAGHLLATINGSDSCPRS